MEDLITVKTRNMYSYSDYMKEEINQLSYNQSLKDVYYKKSISNEQITEDYLKEKYDLSLKELEAFIEKYEPERTI